MSEAIAREVHENRPLSIHKTQGVILPVSRAQKLILQINVELMGNQEVFGRPADSLERLRSMPTYIVCS